MLHHAVGRDIHNILSNLPPDALEECLQAWSGPLQDEQDAKKEKEARKKQPDPAKPRRGTRRLSAVAIDGKEVRHASKRRGSADRCRMAAAVEQSSGTVLGQQALQPDSNEIPAVRDLAADLDLQGRVVTLDAMHAQQETARFLVEDCPADYILTAVKGHQESLLHDWNTLPCDGCPGVETVAKGHGRSDTRRYCFQDISAPQCNNHATLHGRRSAILIQRTRCQVQQDQTSKQCSVALTSLHPGRATPPQIAPAPGRSQPAPRTPRAILTPAQPTLSALPATCDAMRQTYLSHPQSQN